MDESVCTARHSHSACFWADHVVISGGCSNDETPIGDLILVDTKNDFSARKLELTTGPLRTRYSHTSHIVDDTLILVGGVNDEEILPGLCFVDLKSLRAAEFPLPVSILLNDRFHFKQLIHIFCHGCIFR